MRRGKGLHAALALKDGEVLRGKGFGFPRRIVGEVVFNTGMVGYTESLSDPSYRGQILCFTYPLIGNYGVPSYSQKDEYGLPTYFESDRMQVSGLILQDLCEEPNHWASSKSLSEWLREEGVPGIYDIDARELTKKIRIHGVMMGCLQVSEEPPDENELFNELKASKSYGEIDFADEVSPKSPMVYPGKGGNVVLVDCGAKYNILRNLLKHGFTVIRLPYSSTMDEVMKYEPCGVVLSNGPGDPELCVRTVNLTRRLIEEEVPTFGICLGNQIAALALSGRTFKLKYGHRGQNKPCVEVFSKRSYVTSQNHGYAVDPDSLRGTDLNVWFTNADDGTVEGLFHTSRPCIAVQYHPEASPGPYDTTFVFDIFAKLMENPKEVKVFRS